MISRRLRAVIADDEPIALRGIARLLAASTTVDVVAACADGDAALTALREQKPDLAFLDIAMPGKSGLEVMRLLPVEDRPVVVFVTALDSFAIDAFDEHAVDYLLKPFDEGRFGVALERACERLASRDARNSQLDGGSGAFRQRGGRSGHLICKRGDEVVFIPHDEIAWCEAADNYVRVHGSQRPFLIRETLRSLEGRLAASGFVRIHRSVIVNQARIRAVRPNSNGEYHVTLADGTQLTLSRGYRKALVPEIARKMSSR